MTKIPYIESLFSWIEKKSEKWYYVYLLAFISIICTCYFNSIYSFDSLKWNTLLLKSKDLTNTLQQLNSQSNEAKTVFRLLLPVIIKIFHLGYIEIHICQYFIGYFLIVFSYKLSSSITKDPVSASFIALGLVCTYFGKTSFFDMFPFWLDGWSYFFIILSMYYSSPFLIFLFSTCAAWNDERAFLALSIVFIYHQIRKFDDNSIFKLKNLFSVNKKGLAVISAILGYLVIRLFLENHYAMHTPISKGLVNISTFSKNIRLLPIGILTFLEGFWLLFAIFTLFAVKEKDYIILSIICFEILIFTIGSGFVLDITRSGSYIMPIIFILIQYLKSRLNLTLLRNIFLLVLFICVIIPPYLIMNLKSGVIHNLGIVNYIQQLLNKPLY